MTSDTKSSKSEYYYIIANLQGNKKTPEYLYYYKANRIYAREKIIQYRCDVKFFFVVPIFINDKSSTNKMAIISYSEHSHPPPPPRKIPATIKTEFIKVFHIFSIFDVTARRLLSSAMLSAVYDRKMTLSIHYIALANIDRVNHLI